LHLGLGDLDQTTTQPENGNMKLSLKTLIGYAALLLTTVALPSLAADKYETDNTVNGTVVTFRVLLPGDVTNAVAQISGGVSAFNNITLTNEDAGSLYDGDNWWSAAVDVGCGQSLNFNNVKVDGLPKPSGGKKGGQSEDGAQQVDGTLIQTVACEAPRPDPVVCVVPNSAPTNSGPVALGPVAGCAQTGQFEYRIALSSLGVGDAEGDPFLFTVTSGSGVIDGNDLVLIGPGVVSVILSISDDPSARNALSPECTPAASLSSPLTVGAQIVYLGSLTAGGNKFQPPLDKKPVTVRKGTSTIPVKFLLADSCSGLSLPICSDFGIPHTISATGPGGVAITVSSGSSNSGINFRYGGECGLGNWIFNLSTKTWAIGDYIITANLNDGTTISTAVAIK
jgi:hypothetical protein